MEHLVFCLYGAMASWGEVAVGGIRHSACYPSKSAIAGLLGAALGIKRSEETQQLELARGYCQAIKIVNSGVLQRDFHTIQAPDSAGKFRYRTRRDELVVGCSRLGTILSQREYLADAQVLVALKATESAHWSLKDLAGALARPKFHLYLGRKAFPLSVPTAAHLIEAENFRHALDLYPLTDVLQYQLTWARQERWRPDDLPSQYYWEGDIEDFSQEDEQFSLGAVQQLSRLDEPLSRKRWQFQPRMEYHWRS
ncbi:type I-E CRISPR-associated protein Cas5/CasD [Microbulbifer sp. MLAF003]|uniref:type I-E CRISPR-associated protein Cas5/CasD n=1 Tax=unclassified Microbulbifer TaxID=2619833 RepID=UPI0024ADFA00|nr:type I-E CRISPR-associated protein Cas5/CasD [Microbulbifer sp. MLAF003]WHI52019.1 type I-E CRISPR-associated protein Cas5/CasD [Microbulbifer sp. MLAF003]